MLHAMSTVRSAVRGFCLSERGAATVDWVIVCAGAMGAGFVAYELGHQTLRSHSANARHEVQSAHFETSWTDGLAMAGSDTWVSDGPTMSVFDGLLGGGEEDTPAADDPRPVAAPVTVVNGDFSTNDSTGWIFSGSGVLLVYGSALGFNAWDTTWGGIASQTVTTQAGFSYFLTLDAYEWGTGTGDHTLVIEVVDAFGAVVATETVLVLDGSTQVLTIPFTATTDETTLRFSNPSSTATIRTDVKIDNISVTPA
jgi:hypothetical protein